MKREFLSNFTFNPYLYLFWKVKIGKNKIILLIYAYKFHNLSKVKKIEEIITPIIISIANFLYFYYTYSTCIIIYDEYFVWKIKIFLFFYLEEDKKIEENRFLYLQFISSPIFYLLSTYNFIIEKSSKKSLKKNF